MAEDPTASHEAKTSLDLALQLLLEKIYYASPKSEIPADLHHNPFFQELSNYLTELTRFGLALSNGDLSQTLKAKGALAGSLKNLQATLQHLTWQTQMIAKGDFNQRVDFMGDFSLAFNTMVARLAEARSALEKSEAVYRSMFENNRAVQILVDGKDGRIVDANPAACAFYGYSRSELRGKTLEEIHIIPSEQIPEFLEQIQHTASNEPVVLPQRLASEEIRTVEIYSSPIEIFEQTLLYSIVHNITERKIAEDALNLRMKQIEELKEELREQAIRDPLTGLFNRRYWNETIDREISRAARTHSPVGLIMLDIDYFKKINDTFGHPAGDQVLQTLGTLLISRLRDADIACRYGGEEFLCLMPGAPLEAALERAEHLRAAFESQQVDFGEAQIKATISLGVAVFPDHGNTSQELLNSADQALYTAKHQGRNCVVLASKAQD